MKNTSRKYSNRRTTVSENTCQNFFLLARDFFHSRTKTKKISRHVFQYHKHRFLRTIFPLPHFPAGEGEKGFPPELWCVDSSYPSLSFIGQDRYLITGWFTTRQYFLYIWNNMSNTKATV
ncbi:DUF1661 domain-containing protein [Porphyromonas gingivalis]|uniref:DUF1661 domain-containing protein n=1 Tax=Porphyromonas gingivalis TaxID=837 RepID=UPI003D15FA0E